jgi:hypothetical protein
MQKEKPSFEVIPNWRRYSRSIPVKSRIDPRYEFTVNQILLPAALRPTALIAATPAIAAARVTAASAIEATATVEAACIDRIA